MMTQTTDTQADLAELRTLVLTLATAVGGILDTLERDAAALNARTRLSDLEEYGDYVRDVCVALEPKVQTTSG